MMLLLGDLALIFPERAGSKENALALQTVSANASLLQPKGLYIPLYEDSGELKTAIDNGAVAAIWQKKLTLPAYTPNNFPVFFVDDLWKGLMNMMARYEKKLAEEDKQNETSWLVLKDKNSPHVKRSTHDISVIAAELKKVYQHRLDRGRE